MPGRIAAKWRPSLALILGFTLSMVLCLPLVGIVAVRYLWPVLGYREAVIVAGCGIVLATLYVGYVLWRILLRPIRALAAQADQITHGGNGALAPLPHYGTREMQALGQATIDMGRILQGREAVLRSYADHVTHELKSPLTVLRGAAELLDSPGLLAADRRRLLGQIDDAADRMTALLEAQRALARAQEPLAMGSARIGDLIDSLRHEFGGLTLTLAADADLPMAGDGLRLVLEHLLANAQAHGATEVTLTATADSLRVADNGPGVSEGNRERVFDPFFTTRREKGGTGMGLPIVRRMLQAHGADITLLDAGPGAVFEVVF
jgi:signal transduction histidine kinase